MLQSNYDFSKEMLYCINKHQFVTLFIFKAREGICTTLADVLNRITDMLHSPKGEAVWTTTELILNAANPGAGITLGVIGNFLQCFDHIKLTQLLLGLNGGFDEERHLNELYNYVSSSTSRAFTVANVLRETIAAKTPKVCMLYGMILKEHLGTQESDFSLDDIIICNALENASDYDLINFRELMNTCINDQGIIEYPKVENERFERTCLWAIYNRLFCLKGKRIIYAR